MSVQEFADSIGTTRQAVHAAARRGCFDLIYDASKRRLCVCTAGLRWRPNPNLQHRKGRA